MNKVLGDLKHDNDPFIEMLNTIFRRGNVKVGDLRTALNNYIDNRIEEKLKQINEKTI